MTTPWIVAFLALTFVVFLLAMLMLGLAQRVVGTLHRIEQALAPGIPGSALGMGGGPQVGDRAPELPVPALDGDSRLGSLVVFLEIGCEACRVLAQDLTRHRLGPSRYETTLIVDDLSLLDDDRAYGAVVLTDPERAIGTAWGVTGTPVAFLLNRNRTVLVRAHPNRVDDLRRLMKQGG